MDSSDEKRLIQELVTLRTSLGLQAPQNFALPMPSPSETHSPVIVSNVTLPVTFPSEMSALVTLNTDAGEVTVWVPPEGKLLFRKKFKELARHEKRRAANAGNAANTSQLVGGSIGGALATSGVIALATASGPLAIAAVIATGVGSVIAAFGILAGHWMNKKKYDHEERMERYEEIAEDLK